MTTKIENNEREVRGQGAGTLARCTELCRTAARKLKQFEEQLAEKLAAEVEASLPRQLIQQVVNEAEALAWATRYPHLFLPDIAEEKIQSARQWNSRQEQILKL